VGPCSIDRYRISGIGRLFDDVYLATDSGAIAAMVPAFRVSGYTPYRDAAPFPVHPPFG